MIRLLGRGGDCGPAGLCGGGPADLGRVAAGPVPDQSADGQFRSGTEDQHQYGPSGEGERAVPGPVGGAGPAGGEGLH